MWVDRIWRDVLGIDRLIVDRPIVGRHIVGRHVGRALNLAAAAAAAMVVLAVSLMAASPSFGQTDRLDQSLVMEDGGNDFCGHCHGRIYRAWRETQHSKTYKSLHRRKLAKQIKRRLGLKRIKSGWQCTKCHFTPIVKEDRVSQSSASVARPAMGRRPTGFASMPITGTGKPRPRPGPDTRGPMPPA